jgi:hypothetical protein
MSLKTMAAERVEERKKLMKPLSPTVAKVVDFTSNLQRFHWFPKLLLIVAIISEIIAVVLAIIQALLHPEVFFSYVMLTIAICAFLKSLSDLSEKIFSMRLEYFSFYK